ncbi:hypothetical protein M0802_014961 [Mischocyttarus mexicanus]|nr:hypothetical protein M0802_014961 [Mischocyttarus mexicanus]
MRVSLEYGVLEKRVSQSIGEYEEDISLLYTVLKLFTKILSEVVAQTGVREEQQAFRKNSSTIDAIFILRQIAEKEIEFNKKTKSLTILKKPCRCKLAVNEHSIEQVMKFRYLRVDITSGKKSHRRSKGTKKESSNGIWLPKRHNLAKATYEHQLQDSYLQNLRKTNYVIRNRNKSRKYLYHETAEEHGNEDPTNHHRQNIV